MKNGPSPTRTRAWRCDLISPNSVRQIWHEPANFGAQTIHRSRGRNVECAVVLVAPRQIRRLFRRDNGTEMMSLRIPDPDSFWPGHKKISSLVDFDSVRNAIVRLTFFVTENTAVAKTSVGGDVIRTDILLCAVIHVEVLAIGRKRQTVGLSQVFGQQTNAALCIEAIHALKGNLLLFS